LRNTIAKILTLLLISAFMSCNYYPNGERIIPKEEVVNNIGLLKSAGFFKEWESLSANETYDSLYELRKKEYKEIFESDYDPKMNLEPIEIAEYDKSKLLFLDLEADVFNGNNVYKLVINRFSELSDGKFNPTELTETWESNGGPIKVSFISDNKITEFEPEYNNDWLHESVFTICKEKLAEKGVPLVYCLDNDGYGYGQAIAIMRLTKSEQKILENGLNWKFESE
jgi:hypothetical protein